ncbi:MAG: Ig-like domain-containing protein, partial [Anaerolineae bacterium]
MRGLFLLLLGVILTALACNFQLGDAPVSQVTATGNTVTFIAPALNSVIQEGASITLAVRVKSENAEATSVEFLHDSQTLGTVYMTSD